jgi:hypothetical protein
MINSKDISFFSGLKKTFSRNFRVSRLFAAYLEHYPEFIKKEMIDSLTEDGFITKKEALTALLGEIFGLDADSSEDRYIIRNYVTPAVRVLDSEKYVNNPYYKNIRIENTSLKNWELRLEEYPAYRAAVCDDMVIGEDYEEYPPLGFFEKSFKFPAVLEDGNEWMTLTPVDLDTCEQAIDAAHGKVVTFGLGLGYYAYMVSEKPQVEKIVVVEKSPDVIELFNTLILPQFPNGKKVEIVNCDAFYYAEHIMPEERFDVAFVDTWRDASDGTPMYRRMKPLEKLSPNTKFLYWIENFLRSRVRAENYGKLLDRIDGGATVPDSAEIIRLLDEI